MPQREDLGSRSGQSPCNHAEVLVRRGKRWVGACRNSVRILPGETVPPLGGRCCPVNVCPSNPPRRTSRKTNGRLGVGCGRNFGEQPQTPPSRSQEFRRKRSSFGVTETTAQSVETPVRKTFPSFSRPMLPVTPVVPCRERPLAATAAHRSTSCRGTSAAGMRSSSDPPSSRTRS